MQDTPALIPPTRPNPRDETQKKSVPTSPQALRSGCTEKVPRKTNPRGTCGVGGESRKIGNNQRAGPKTVFAVTCDGGVGRGNGFGQEMENPIFGPFGGVGAGNRPPARENEHSRGTGQGGGVHRATQTSSEVRAGPTKANRDSPRGPGGYHKPIGPP